MHPVLEQDGGDAVANVVEPDPGCQAGSPSKALEGVGGTVGVAGSTLAVVTDQVGGDPLGADGEAALLL